MPELLELLLPRSTLLQSAVRAMALNHVRTAIIKWPAQPLLDAENVQVQLACGQPFPKHNVIIFCGSLSNWPFSWKLYHHVMHITYESMVNIMVAL